MSIEIKPLPPHGSPADRGSADAYYGRAPSPHYYPNGTYNEPRIEPPKMTGEQVREYLNAYHNEDDRKDWG